MNNRFLMFITNFLYTVSSNLTSLVISSLVVLIVPKLIGVEEYGSWQLYLFYVSFVGFFQFGWNDGVYLRYGGKKYQDLDKGMFFSQFWMLSISQVVLGSIIVITSVIFVSDTDRQFIYIMVALCMIIIGIRCMLLFILQGTNRIKEYSQITVIEKVLYCFFILLFLLVGIRQFKFLIVADLIGKLLSFIYSIYCCKDIVFRKISSFYLNIKEAIENINVGIKLMFANIASLLIIGIVRYGIEFTWDVATFGKVSLIMSVSNFMMIFINAVGIIMFPLLRRSDESKLAIIYVTMRNLLMAPLLGILIVYYPIKVILSAWLPLYIESLMFMSLIFPMCVYEGEISLLINTYLKTMRKEKLMLLINMIMVMLSIIITFISTVVLHNLTLSIVSIVVLLAFRCILAELFLAKILHISLYRHIIIETAVIVTFILTGWFIDSGLGAVIYLVAFGVYVMIQRKDIIITLATVKKLIRG